MEGSRLPRTRLPSWVPSRRTARSRATKSLQNGVIFQLFWRLTLINPPGPSGSENSFACFSQWKLAPPALLPIVMDLNLFVILKTCLFLVRARPYGGSLGLSVLQSRASAWTRPVSPSRGSSRSSEGPDPRVSVPR